MFSGTAIGPHHFITAKHCGGQVGDIFQYAGGQYEAINFDVVPGADLTVWTVAETLPYWATLQNQTEVGLPAILFGRGTKRGREITVNGVVRGWEWGPGDGARSWGLAQVAAIVPTDVGASVAGGQVTSMLALPFEASYGPNAGTVSSGDSGGGVFVKDFDGTWKLAGIIHGVTNTSGAVGYGTYQAAIFEDDTVAPSGGFSASANSVPTGGSVALATRVATYRSFIHTVLNKPPQRLWLTRRRAVVLAGFGVFAGVCFLIFRLRVLLRLHKQRLKKLRAARCVVN